MKFTKEQKAAREKLYKHVDDDWKLRKGKAEWLKYLETGEVTRKEAMLAQCYHCMGGYDDGPQDCGSAICSLYPFMPYRDGRSRKEVTDEQREASSKRFKEMWAKRKGEN